MKNYQPIQQIHSSAFDKVVKSLTILFILTTFTISIILDILHGFIDTHSNVSEYNSQYAIFTYIANNLNASPIKQLYFRDLYCDSSEETIPLFPYDNSNITRWNSQFLCVTRYSSIRYSEQCNATTEYLCGPYCISQSEGTQCPISKVTIVTTDSSDEDADQNLDSTRDLYITRDNGTYGIYTFDVTIKGYPCYNTLVKVTGGLNKTNDYSECDTFGQDTDNSIRIEQTTLKNFVDQGNVSASGYDENQIAYLVARNKLKTNILDICTNLNTQNIMDVLDYAESVDEIGLVYLILKSIFEALIFLLFVIELILLKGRAVNDLRILSCLLKILLICLMSFIMIQGGLILYQDQRQYEVQTYYQSRYSCYDSKQIQNIFATFPNLFSDDLITYIYLQTLALVIVGITLGVLSSLFLVQMFQWCLREKNQPKRGRQISEQALYTDPYFQNQLSPRSIINPQQLSNPIPENKSNSQPKLTDSYQPPQIEVVQVELGLGKKNNKY